MGFNFEEMFVKKAGLSRMQKLQYWTCLVIQVLGHHSAARFSSRLRGVIFCYGITLRMALLQTIRIQFQN